MVKFWANTTSRKRKIFRKHWRSFFSWILSIEIGEKESAKYWLGVLNSLKNRGLKDAVATMFRGSGQKISERKFSANFSLCGFCLFNFRRVYLQKFSVQMQIVHQSTFAQQFIFSFYFSGFNTISLLHFGAWFCEIWGNRCRKYFNALWTREWIWFVNVIATLIKVLRRFMHVQALQIFTKHITI